MEQNLKELFEKDRLVNHPRREDHEDLFVERLYQELPIKTHSSYGVVKIAASIIIFVSLGIASYFFVNQEKQLDSPELVLSNLSPDLKEIESYYITNINSTLSFIKDDNESQFMVNRYMKRFEILKKEHKSLVLELQEEGPNTMSINALMNNLKKQFELLQALKVEIEELKINNYEII